MNGDAKAVQVGGDGGLDAERKSSKRFKAEELPNPVAGDALGLGLGAASSSSSSSSSAAAGGHGLLSGLSAMISGSGTTSASKANKRSRAEITGAGAKTSISADKRSRAEDYDYYGDDDEDDGMQGGVWSAGRRLERSLVERHLLHEVAECVNFLQERRVRLDLSGLPAPVPLQKTHPDLDDQWRKLYLGKDDDEKESSNKKESSNSNKEGPKADGDSKDKANGNADAGNDGKDDKDKANANPKQSDSETEDFKAPGDWRCHVVSITVD